MNAKDLNNRLDEISTWWTKIIDAHRADGKQAVEAQQQLMERYNRAIYRYLLAAVRDPDLAEDLSQEFALRFIEGRFHSANPERGRFRDYVKTCLFHLVSDYRQRRAREPDVVPLTDHDPCADLDHGTDAESFEASWRTELLSRAWKSLHDIQNETKQPLYTVLRYKADHPETRSPQMAEQLSLVLGRELNPSWVRKLLERARLRFGELLIEETARSLGPGAEHRLEEELAELNLLKYCQDLLDRRKQN